MWPTVVQASTPVGPNGDTAVSAVSHFEHDRSWPLFALGSADQRSVFQTEEISWGAVESVTYGGQGVEPDGLGVAGARTCRCPLHEPTSRLACAAALSFGGPLLTGWPAEEGREP